MIPLTPRFVIAAANAFVGFAEEGGDNRGQVVEFMLARVRQPAGQPWCAAFVYHVGWSAHYDNVAGMSTWPLRATASCQELHDDAKRIRNAVVEEPMEGDVFLVWRPKLRRFGHTGFVVSVDAELEGSAARYRCTTVEGNTNADGSANGNAVLRRTRIFSSQDRFIRWVEMPPVVRRAA